MARTATKTAVVAEVVADADLPGLPTAVAAANQLAVMQTKQEAAAQAIATEIGYEGTLTIGALEDEIRFYQRRTVESLLELGKRLLVLRELTPHGEFEKRVEFLGFSYRSAARFIQAAAKTAKSANLALLSTQVKSASAFLELVTHDDDVLENLKDIDDIDRMSAGELRNAIRSLQGDLEAKDAVLDKTQKKLTSLQVQLKKKVVADTDWPDALEPVSEQVAAAGRKLAQAISELETCRITLFEVAQEVPDEQRPKYDAALAHIAEVYEQALSRAETGLEKERTTFDKSLGAYTPEAA
ncbi:TPA: hypothetical protein NHP85_001503 [Pseudomonas aeruginosa]|nr:hypothetical protein [Pseudomonas aeruginosa]